MQPFDQPAICARCAHILTSDPHATCPRCSSTVGPFIELAAGCPSCRDQHLAFDRAFRLGPYDGLLRDAILRMKHPRGEGLAEALGSFWAAQLAPRLQPLTPDLVIPVPLHWWRHWQRGFNQSEILARHLAVQLGIPCRATWLRRARRTAQQSTQSPAARWENVRGAFSLRPGADLAGKTILLVDDVLTTGATASEAARVLRPLKPRLIVVVVLGHGR